MLTSTGTASVCSVGSSSTTGILSDSLSIEFSTLAPSNSVLSLDEVVPEIVESVVPAVEGAGAGSVDSSEAGDSDKDVSGTGDLSASLAPGYFFRFHRFHQSHQFHRIPQSVGVQAKLLFFPPALASCGLWCSCLGML